MTTKVDWLWEIIIVVVAVSRSENKEESEMQKGACMPTNA